MPATSTSCGRCADEDDTALTNESSLIMCMLVAFMSTVRCLNTCQARAVAVAGVLMKSAPLGIEGPDLTVVNHRYLES